MTQDELKALIEDLRLNHEFCPTEVILKAADELERLAQPEQEPEWYHGIDVYGCNRFYHKTEDRTSEFNTPLYTAPPTWVGLSDEERQEIALEVPIDAVLITEAKLKEKNT